MLGLTLHAGALQLAPALRVPDLKGASPAIFMKETEPSTSRRKILVDIGATLAAAALSEPATAMNVSSPPNVVIKPAPPKAVIMEAPENAKKAENDGGVVELLAKFSVVQAAALSLGAVVVAFGNKGELGQPAELEEPVSSIFLRDNPLFRTSRRKRETQLDTEHFGTVLDPASAEARLQKLAAEAGSPYALRDDATRDAANSVAPALLSSMPSFSMPSMGKPPLVGKATAAIREPPKWRKEFSLNYLVSPPSASPPPPFATPPSPGPSSSRVNTPPSLNPLLGFFGLLPPAKAIEDKGANWAADDWLPTPRGPRRLRKPFTLQTPEVSGAPFTDFEDAATTASATAAPVWGQAAKALESVAGEAWVQAANAADCEAGDEVACDELSNDDDAKKEWLAQIDARKWGDAAAAVAEVAETPNLSEDAARAAWLARLDASTWGQAAAALASVVADATEIADLIDKCDTGDDVACEELTNEDAAKNAWLAKLDAPSWGAAATAVSEVAVEVQAAASIAQAAPMPGPMSEEEAKAAWLAKHSAPTGGQPEADDATRDTAQSVMPTQIQVPAPSLEDKAKAAWLAKQDSPAWGLCSGGSE